MIGPVIQRDAIRALGGNATIHQVDVRDRAAVDGVVAEIAAQHGRIIFAGPKADAPAFDAVQTTDLDGRWVTPPLACGLLPGVGRAVALREGRVVEAVLRVSDVPQVREWAFVNSLRGWLAARVLPSDLPVV